MMKHILFVARDPGGANAILPLIKVLNMRYHISVLAKDSACHIMQKEDVCFRNFNDAVNENNVQEILDEILPDLIITGTSADDYLEKFIWEAAKNRKIKTIAIIDQWINYSIRFSKYNLNDIHKLSKKDIIYLPDYICVMDEKAKSDAIDEGVPSQRIVVTGQPHFEYLKSKYLKLSKEQIEDVRRYYGVGEGEKLLLFASEDISKTYGDTASEIYWGYNEKTIFPLVMDKIEEFGYKQVKVVLRPHPKEDREYWLEYQKHTQRSFIVDSSFDSNLVIASADLIVGMQSMFLIESVVSEKPVLSVQVGLKRNNPLIISELGIVNTAYNEVELENVLKKMLYQDHNNKWDVAENAIENICNLVEEIL